MNLISLKTELRQELKLTPQLLQSMEVLQMNSQELLDYLGKISEENPTLELSEASELRSAYAELRKPVGWTRGPLGPPLLMRRMPHRSRERLIRSWTACLRFSAISWNGNDCRSPCWPCVNIWRSWWTRTDI